MADVLQHDQVNTGLRQAAGLGRGMVLGGDAAVPVVHPRHRQHRGREIQALHPQGLTAMGGRLLVTDQNSGAWGGGFPRT